MHATADKNQGDIHMTTIKTVGIAGTGLIGAGWAARLLFRGYDVIAYDVSPTAEAGRWRSAPCAWLRRWATRHGR